MGDKQSGYTNNMTKALLLLAVLAVACSATYDSDVVPSSEDIAASPSSFHEDAPIKSSNDEVHGKHNIPPPKGTEGVSDVVTTMLVQPTTSFVSKGKGKGKRRGKSHRHMRWKRTMYQARRHRFRVYRKKHMKLWAKIKARLAAFKKARAAKRNKMLAWRKHHAALWKKKRAARYKKVKAWWKKRKARRAL